MGSLSEEILPYARFTEGEEYSLLYNLFLTTEIIFVFTSKTKSLFL